MSSDAIGLRIIDAMEKLWNSILEIRKFTSQFTFFQRVLLPQEYDRVFSEKGGKTVPQMTRREFYLKTYQLSSGVESLRPLVGETIWYWYDTYEKFALRQAVKIQEGLENGKLYAWNRDADGQPDNFVHELLGAVFTKEELAQIDSFEEPGVTAKVMRTIELKTLNEMNDWIFNKQFQKLDFSKQLSIQTLIAPGGDVNIGRDLVGRDDIEAISNLKTETTK